ncbi:MAG TPA: hypothetical protein VM553_07170 [Dongiaceae bacterium]|nr:hypothetical protein [Dongiaceae bacterium]
MAVREEAFLRDKADHLDFSSLKQDVEVLRKDIAKLSNSLLSQAKTGAESVVSNVQAKSNQAVHQAEEKIGERPFVSLLVSFILGLILAKMLDHKSN